MGSKSRHAAEIIAIATANRKPGTPWVEPFVGGGNVICRVPPGQGPRIGADINRYMIALLDAVGNRGWLPPETMTEPEFRNILDFPQNHPLEMVGFTATGATFGSVWCGPWVKDDLRTYGQARNAARRDAPGLKGVVFHCSSYLDLTIPSKSLVYCDPPYAFTSGYTNLSSKRSGARVQINVGEDLSKNIWDAGKFWRWVDALVDVGHTVFVSEYRGPPTSIYKGSPTIVAKREAAAARFRALQADDKSSREGRDAAANEIRTTAEEERKEAAHFAARWQVLWEKEVPSDFHSKREAGVKDGKREVEKLFHRAP